MLAAPRQSIDTRTSQGAHVHSMYVQDKKTADPEITASSASRWEVWPHVPHPSNGGRVPQLRTEMAARHVKLVYRQEHAPFPFPYTIL